MGAMIATGAGLPADRPLTVDDLEFLPDDGSRYELDDGVLVVSPAPANIHQLVVSRLQMRLGALCPEEFLVVSGNGVAMTRSQYRIPDLVVVRAERFDLAAKSVNSPPELAIEVASPSTALYDRNRKKTVYAEFGIPSFWIVTPDPAKPGITAYELLTGEYQLFAEATRDEVFRAQRPFFVDIVPAALVAPPTAR